MYDIENHIFFVSRDVVFLENHFPFVSNIAPVGQLVQLTPPWADGDSMIESLGARGCEGHSLGQEPTTGPEQQKASESRGSVDHGPEQQELTGPGPSTPRLREQENSAKNILGPKTEPRHDKQTRRPPARLNDYICYSAQIKYPTSTAHSYPKESSGTAG